MRFAPLLERSVRQLYTWKARAMDPESRGPGRQAHSAALRLEVARAVAKERRVQGEKVGVPAIAAALPKLPLRLVREEMAASKKRFRVAGRRMMAARRVSMRVAGRDVLWSLDATHLGRRQNGKEVQAQAVREVASTRTLAVSIGPTVTSEDAVAVMESAAATRGGRYPLRWSLTTGRRTPRNASSASSRSTACCTC